MFSMFILQIIFLIIFFIKRLNPLKSFMLKINSYKQRATNFFHPHKNMKKKKKKKKSRYDFEGDDDKFISKDNFNVNKNELKNSGNHLTIKKFDIFHLKEKEEINDSNSIQKIIVGKKEEKIIVANNFGSTINIQTPLNNIKNKNIINIKVTQKKTY